MADTKYKSAALKQFSALLRSEYLRDFLPYHAGRDSVRLHGAFVQLMALSGGRYGHTLHVLPTFYVVGARPWDEVITQSISVDSIQPRDWRIQDASLDHSLAALLNQRIEKASPIPYSQPLTNAAIVKALEFFEKRGTSEVASMGLAFFLMSLGRVDVASRLKLARKTFMKDNNPIKHDWQHNVVKRLDVLEARVSQPDCVELCRREAEEHAQRLGLPALWTE